MDINDGNDLSYAAEILLGVSVFGKAYNMVYDGVKSDDFYNDLPLEEREVFDNMTHSEQQALIESAKQGIREEQTTDEDAMQ